MTFLPSSMLLPLFFTIALAVSGCASTQNASVSGNPTDASPLGTPGSAQTNAQSSPRPPQVDKSNPLAKTSGSPALAEPYFPSGALTPISAAEASRLGVAELAAPRDLWERIRRGFAMPDLQSELVADREQWYTARPDYIFRMTERSRKYLFHIVEELELRNMPTELALLPFIESAFNPQAVSSAKAAGMWQFMPATGKYFELKQNAFRDDRRDVLASTRAALDYLQKLHARFGDWHLALAAYNWGEGSVGRAMTKNKNAGLAQTYLDLGMPAETRLYVPKLQAVKNIVNAPQSFSSTLPLIENHPFFQTVTITRDIDVALAAKLADVSVDDFKALNPSANRPVILAAGTPQILLPWDQAAIFQTNLSNFAGPRLASWTVWTAPTTMKTADAAKKVGMSESELREVNRIPARVMIQTGSTLLVPKGQQVANDVPLQVADNGQIALSPEISMQRTVFKAGKNDTVASVAKRYKLSPAAVGQWNQLSASSAFKVGQQVVLHLPVRAKSAATQSGARGAARKASASTRRSAKISSAKPQSRAKPAKRATARGG